MHPFTLNRGKKQFHTVKPSKIRSTTKYYEWKSIAVYYNYFHLHSVDIINRIAVNWGIHPLYLLGPSYPAFPYV